VEAYLALGLFGEPEAQASLVGLLSKGKNKLGRLVPLLAVILDAFDVAGPGS
jgi:hypothetical protein